AGGIGRARDHGDGDGCGHQQRLLYDHLHGDRRYGPDGDLLSDPECQRGDELPGGGAGCVGRGERERQLQRDQRDHFEPVTGSATCTTTFTVTDDTAPTVICPATTSASAGTNCLAAVPDVLGGVSASDSCSGTNGIFLYPSPLGGTLVGLGVHVITVTATDA